jgi:hypothetical protein
VWAFAWWPHALLHGLNPFYPHLIYAPQGIDIAHGTLLPGAALLFAPVTAIAGPLFAFNLAMLLSPVLAAWFAFLLCRYVTRAFWPSLLGGWLFGFSTYMLGQLVGHLNLTLVFLVPAIVHLVLRALSGELGRRRFIVLLALALTLQFSFSVETFVSMTLFGAAALAIGYALADPHVRVRFSGLLAPIGSAYLATALLVSPCLYYALQPGGPPVLPQRSDMISTDLLAFVVPTQITALGGGRLISISQSFTATYVENGAYLGPLLLMMVLGARSGWRRVEIRVMLSTLLVVVLCTFGGQLHIDGTSTIPLPWALVNHLPVLGVLIPARFMLYGVMIGSILAAMWLATTNTRRSGWLLALLSLACLLPAVWRNYWDGTPDLPSLFTSSAYQDAIGPRDVALVLPVGSLGQSMLWQAEAHLGFTMASGYVVPPDAPDPYQRYAIYKTLTTGATIANEQSAAATFLTAEHITVAVLDARAPATNTWAKLLEQLGWTPQTQNDVLLLRPTARHPRTPATNTHRLRQKHRTNGPRAANCPIHASRGALPTGSVAWIDGRQRCC